MSAIIAVAVLGAAILHASWNAMLKSGSDRFWVMTLLCLGSGCIALVALPIVGFPARSAWPYVGASAVIHTVYQLLLVRMYAVGDFGQTYPIARGSSPLLVTLGAFLLAHEALSAHKLAGIILVSGGIIALAFEGRKFHFDRAPAAILTGLSIGAYTIVDGLGARVSGNVPAYFASSTVLWMLFIAAVYVHMRGLALPRLSRYDAATGIVGSVIATIGYFIVVWAMTTTPMGLVSALRETSVIFAALIARVFLKERLTVGRLGACIVIAAGGALLGT